MKGKLRDESGKSMVLALVFLLVCLFLGSTVLTAATANAGRASHQDQENQCYVSQRSAMLLMADLLKSTPESQLQLTIQDVKVSDGTATERTVTYQIHGETGYTKSLLQKLLYGYAVNRYEAEHGGLGDRRYENFDFTDESNRDFSPGGWNNAAGTFQIAAALPGVEETLEAAYLFSEGYDFQILLENADGAGMHLTMNAYFSTGAPVVITMDGRTTTTVTTVIRWDDPVIGKGDGA